MKRTRRTKFQQEQDRYDAMGYKDALTGLPCNDSDIPRENLRMAYVKGYKAGKVDYAYERELVRRLKAQISKLESLD